MFKKLSSLLILTAFVVGFVFNLTSCANGDEDCVHEWSEWEVKKEATCGESGYSVRYCKKCMATDRRVEFKLPHPMSNEWVYDGTYHWHTATCEHKGIIGDKGQHVFENNKCKICGAMRATQGLEYVGNLLEQTYTVKGIGQTLDTDIVVARYYSGYLVTGIGARAFANVVGLKSVSMQKDIKTIEDEAFAENDYLVSIEFTKGTEYIGANIINDCPKLSSVTFFGTLYDWNKLEKHPNWKGNCKGFNVVCTDGVKNY